MAKNFNECENHLEMLALIDRTTEKDVWLLFQVNEEERLEAIRHRNLFDLYNRQETIDLFSSLTPEQLEDFRGDQYAEEVMERLGLKFS